MGTPWWLQTESFPSRGPGSAEEAFSPARRQKRPFAASRGAFFPGQERCRPGDVTVRLQWLSQAGAAQAGLGKNPGKSLNKPNVANEMTKSRRMGKGADSSSFCRALWAETRLLWWQTKAGMLSLSRRGRDHVVTRYPSPEPCGEGAGTGLCRLLELPICWGFLSGRRQEAVPGQSKKVFPHLQRIQPNQINEHWQTDSRRRNKTQLPRRAPQNSDHRRGDAVFPGRNQRTADFFTTSCENCRLGINNISLAAISSFLKKLPDWSLVYWQAEQTHDSLIIHSLDRPDVPILVESNTSLEGIFFFSSSKASIRFSFGCPGSSRIDFHLLMSSTTTTLWEKEKPIRKVEYCYDK